MTQVIVYTQDSGVAAVIYPTEEALSTYGIHAIAQKDVPAGVSYAIVDSSELPTDRSQRDEWALDPERLVDGIGSSSSEFPASEVA